jgi:uncharacterized protein (UPF0548 family)
MRLVLSRQPPGPEACARWLDAPATSPPEGLPTGIYDRYEAQVHCRRGESADAAFERIRGRLFAYDIFPRSLIRFALCSGRRIELDGLIIQRAGVGPIRLESAVRVVDLWDRDAGDAREAGFRYVTLAGHPERGVASFAVRRDSSGDVQLTLDARSQAGAAMARLGRPVARRVQLAATHAAMKRLAGKPRPS